MSKPEYQPSHSAGDFAAPLGIFGGTFDPVHVGHLTLAEQARSALSLSGVRWLPAGAPPLRAAPRTPGAQRLAMVERAIAGNPAFTLDASEVTRAARGDAPSYTVTSLERIRCELGSGQPLVLLLGADAFANLSSWHEWQRLFELAHIAVATRPGVDLAQVGAGNTAIADQLRRRASPPDALRRAGAGAIVPFDITPLAISATVIRERLAQQRSVRYLVPDLVIDYLNQHQLYG
jgi:nicotinate-nucleotide adenylyltransferase